MTEKGMTRIVKRQALLNAKMKVMESRDCQLSEKTTHGRASYFLLKGASLKFKILFIFVFFNCTGTRITVVKYAIFKL